MSALRTPLAEITALFTEIVRVNRVGSRVTCSPPPTDTDEDVLVRVTDVPAAFEALAAAGIASDDPNVVALDPALPKACAPLLAQAHEHFIKSDEIMARNSRRVVRAPRIMSKYYHAILDRLVARGFALPREPVRLSTAAKLMILARYAVI